jgi:tRNA-specific 2-thiouridylase
VSGAGDQKAMTGAAAPSSARVIVGMSGGVDSSVAAWLLIQAGYRVEGLFMKNWDEDDDTEYCTAKADLADARAVCERLGIVLHTASFAAEYWDSVFEHFLQEYRAGRTPNPDILCNREIKFKAFQEYASELGADLIATGHYVRKQVVDGATRLLKGRDPDKDQSYFLCEVSERCLAGALFPVGELQKSEVRDIARQNGFVTHDKKDSTGICFIGERKFSDFLARYLPARPGPIRTLDSEEIGQHNGLMYYTIGQRQGIGIGGLRKHDEAPWYVVDKDLQRNVLLVAQGNDNPRLFASELQAAEPSWINRDHPQPPLACHAKIRYRQEDQRCRIERSNGEHIAVHFERPQRAVTPGQYVVFYEGEICLGGAVIERRLG